MSDLGSIPKYSILWGITGFRRRKCYLVKRQQHRMFRAHQQPYFCLIRDEYKRPLGRFTYALLAQLDRAAVL